MAPSRHSMKITIDDWQYQILRDVASQTHQRMSSLVRDILSEKLRAKEDASPSDAIFGIVGMASGDGTSVAERHDDILYGERS